MEQVEACLPTASKPARKKVVEARRPTPRMEAYWEAIHEAKHSLRYVKLNKPLLYGEGSLEEDNERGLTESLVSSP